MESWQDELRWILLRLYGWILNLFKHAHPGFTLQFREGAREKESFGRGFLWLNGRHFDYYYYYYVNGKGWLWSLFIRWNVSKCSDRNIRAEQGNEEEVVKWWIQRIPILKSDPGDLNVSYWRGGKLFLSSLYWRVLGYILLPCSARNRTICLILISVLFFLCIKWIFLGYFTKGYRTSSS